MDSLLSIRNVAKTFGKTSVLRDVSLEVAEGEFLTILGESGSGKTTLLRVIAGFEQATSGELWMDGARLDALPPYKRPFNTVFQHYALFPHLTIGDNVGYGLRIAGVSSAETATRVAEALAMVKMTAHAEKKPSKISGGQQQRVALARALVNRPKLLLLDEPLSALDANLRRQMQIELKALQREVGIAFVFITHDQEEAMVMSDRIALLKGGRFALDHFADLFGDLHRAVLRAAHAAKVCALERVLRQRLVVHPPGGLGIERQAELLVPVEPEASP